MKEACDDAASDWQNSRQREPGVGSVRLPEDGVATHLPPAG